MYFLGVAVAEIEIVGKASVTQGITLKAITFGLVSNPSLVSMIALKTDRLLITGNISPKFPSSLAALLNPAKKGVYLVHRILLSCWHRLRRVLDAEESLEVPMPRFGIRPDRPPNQIISRNFVLKMRPKLEFNLWADV
jgi:hypothetical protein